MKHHILSFASFIMTFCGLMHFTAIHAGDSVATVAEASKVIDLRTVAVPENAVVSSPRQVGHLMYEIPTPPKAAYEFHRKAMLKDGWKELPGTSLEATYANGMFSKSGFTVNCSVSSNGQEGNNAATYVSLYNFGNVALDKVPVIKGATSIFANAASASYATETPVPKAAEQMMGLLRENGWQFYGVNALSDEQHFLNVRKNAVQLSIMVAKAPAQGDKTMISISSLLMSAEIPAPETAEQLQFDGSSKTLRFETQNSFAEISDFYKKELVPTGWKPTSEKPAEADDEFGRQTALQVFRNAGKEWLSIDMMRQDDHVNVTAQFMTRQDLEDAEKEAREAARIALADKEKQEADLQAARDEAKMEFEQSSAEFDALSNKLIAEALGGGGNGKSTDQKAGKSSGSKGTFSKAVVVKVPAGTDVEEAAENVLKLTVGAGKGEKTATAIVEAFEADGWNLEQRTTSNTSGTYTITSKAGQINMTFVETGVTDVTLMVIGVGVVLTSEEIASTATSSEGKPKKKSGK